MSAISALNAFLNYSSVTSMIARTPGAVENVIDFRDKPELMPRVAAKEGIKIGLTGILTEGVHQVVSKIAELPVVKDKPIVLLLAKISPFIVGPGAAEIISRRVTSLRKALGSALNPDPLLQSTAAIDNHSLSVKHHHAATKVAFAAAPAYHPWNAQSGRTEGFY